MLSFIQKFNETVPFLPRICNLSKSSKPASNILDPVLPMYYVRNSLKLIEYLNFKLAKTTKNDEAFLFGRTFKVKFLTEQLCGRVLVAVVSPSCRLARKTLNEQRPLYVVWPFFEHPPQSPDFYGRLECVKFS